MKIYVACPSSAVTGGPEALHQLVHTLVESGFDAYIVYFPNQMAVTPAYQHYQTPVASFILDEDESCFIVPEIWPHYLNLVQKAKKFIWWLSVDNRDSTWESWGDFSITHLAQSTYAYNFLQSKRVGKVAYLREFIGAEHLQALAANVHREDYIAYNPKKGLEFTNFISRIFPELRFVPIEGLSPHEVRDILHKVKIYMDFGHHPGQDRLVREAALAGCAVITGDRGSARFYDDIPIPESYKFSGLVPEEINTSLLAKTIEHVFNHFEEISKDFDRLRQMCHTQREQMKHQVSSIFGNPTQITPSPTFNLFKSGQVLRKLRPSLL